VILGSELHSTHGHTALGAFRLTAITTGLRQHRHSWIHISTRCMAKIFVHFCYKIRVFKNWGFFFAEGGLGLPAQAPCLLHRSFTSSISPSLQRPGHYGLWALSVLMRYSEAFCQCRLHHKLYEPLPSNDRLFWFSDVMSHCSLFKVSRP
jgi:hypothetical protein